ncbi:hypothetical protein SLE2022_270590 [Rubroshorea leprosula]
MTLNSWTVSNLDELRLRAASRAAHSVRNKAKLKRERAHRLMFRADVAIHKAVAALMTADAIKASFEDSNENPNGYGWDDDKWKLIKTLSSGIQEYSRHSHCFRLLFLPFLVMVAWSPH